MTFRRMVGNALSRFATLVLAASGSWLIAIRNDFPGMVTFLNVPLSLHCMVSGVVLILAGIGLQVVLGWRADKATATTDNEISDLRVAMKDALQPLVKLVSAMPDMTPANRLRHLATVAENASAATASLLMSHVPRARASVYYLEPDGSALRVMAYQGRGERPGEFVSGGTASDAAIERVQSGRGIIVKDWKIDPPPGSSLKNPDWRSFVSVPIVSGDGFAFGMFNVDAPEPNKFLDTDRHTVTVVAELLAVAFSIAYPRRSRSASARKVGQAR